jgi:sn-glycerol 3-phosphate transport system ATP-binding protein
MAEVILENVTKKFNDDRVAVNNISLEINDGDFCVFVGPSGCGKSTTLRMIAGLETQTSGKIYIDGKDVSNVRPAKRGVAMVFQNYALYPTMTVRENIEFGLINNKVEKSERDRLIDEIAEVVSLRDYMNSLPQELSGGQRQRVALARAMVKKPKVFILDEPLSNLDAKLRVQMRNELIKLHKRLETTFIYVTHDQVEAMSMGDEIVVLNNGEIMQVDSPSYLYNNPKDVFVAQFIGTPPMNVFRSEDVKNYFLSIDPYIKYIGFRPEDAKLYKSRVQIPNSIVMGANIDTVEVLGSEIIYTLNTKFGDLKVKDFDKSNILSGEAYIVVEKRDLKYFGENQKIVSGDVSPIDYIPKLERVVS